MGHLQGIGNIRLGATVADWASAKKSVKGCGSRLTHTHTQSLTDKRKGRKKLLPTFKR